MSRYQLRKTCRYENVKLRVIRKEPVGLHNTKAAVERMSQYVLVVTERIIAGVALYFSPCFRFHGSSLSPIFLLDICNIYQLCFV